MQILNKNDMILVRGKLKWVNRGGKNNQVEIMAGAIIPMNQMNHWAFLMI